MEKRSRRGTNRAASAALFGRYTAKSKPTEQQQQHPQEQPEQQKEHPQEKHILGDKFTQST